MANNRFNQIQAAYSVTKELMDLCTGPKEQLLHIDWDDADFDKAELVQCLMLLTARFAGDAK